MPTFLHDTNEQVYVKYCVDRGYWFPVNYSTNHTTSIPHIGCLVYENVQPLNVSHKSFLGYYVFFKVVAKIRVYSVNPLTSNSILMNIAKKLMFLLNV